jgi:ADP-heptose:LPS heptosyltransferase
MNLRRAHALVARLDNAGDVLLAGPAVRAIAAAAERVTFVASRAGEPAVDLLPGVDEVVVFDAPWVGYDPTPVDPTAVGDFVGQIKRLGIDAAFVLTSSHQSALPLALLLRLAGVPWIAANCDDYPGALLDLRRRPRGDQEHEVERALGLALDAGARLPEGDDGRLGLRAPLPDGRPFDEPYVVVHPGASVPARGCDAPRARRVVDLLVEEGRHVAVTGGASEAELTRAVAGARRARVRDLAGTTSFRELSGVIAGADAVVCGNTALAHLAAAVGTPVVSIFAPVVPAARWAPWRVPTVMLGDQSIECAGCRARTCPVPGQPCLAPATPYAIAHAVAALAPGREVAAS